MSSDLKTYIQEVPLLTEQQARLLKGKIYNRPMSIPYKVDNTVYFLTPIVKNDNHHLRVQYGNKNKAKGLFRKKKTKLEKLFINPNWELTKKTLSKEGDFVECKDLQDHSVFLLSYKDFIFEKFLKKIKSLPDEVKHLSQDGYDAIENFVEHLGKKTNQEFVDLKDNLNEFKTRWNIYRETNSVKKAGKEFNLEVQQLYKKIKHEINTLKDDVSILFKDEETDILETEKNSLEKLTTKANKQIYNSACDIFDEFNIKTGMIYYFNEGKFYCIYRGNNHYLKACDRLIAMMHLQDLASQNRNLDGSPVKNQNTFAKNLSGNHIQLLKKALIVVSILVTAGLIGALIACAAVFFSPFIALTLIPVLVLSSLGLCKVCKNTQVVSRGNSLSGQLPKFKSKYVQDRVSSAGAPFLAGPSHDPKTDNNPNPNDERTTTTNFKVR